MCVAAALAACSSAGEPVPAERAPSKTAAASSNEGPLDLEWEFARGWEPRETLDTYVKLEYTPLGNQKALRAMLTAGKPLRDKAVIAQGDEVCAPAFVAAVAAEKPDRLLLRIEGKVTTATTDCLDQLATPRLYLGMCPGRGSTIGDCDGDAELAALAAGHTMERRLRGLAIGFSQKASWKHIARFAALEYLTVRGSALANIDAEAEMTICQRTELRALDVWDPNQDPPYLERDPVCVYMRERFASWGVHDAPPPNLPCRLRHLFVWDIEPPLRAALQRACPDLAIESAH